MICIPWPMTEPNIPNQYKPVGRVFQRVEHWEALRAAGLLLSLSYSSGFSHNASRR